MSIGYAIVVGVIAIASLVTSLVLSNEAKKAMAQLKDYSKTGLSDFTVTQQSEGLLLPVLYGSAVLCGNLIWWKSEKVNDEYYRIKAWLTLCAGEVEEGWWYGSPYGVHYLPLYLASRQQKYGMFVDDQPKFFAYMPRLYLVNQQLTDNEKIARWSAPYHFLQTGTNLFPVKSADPAYDFISDILANFSGYPLKNITSVCVGMHQYHHNITGISTPPLQTWIDLEQGIAQMPNYSWYVTRKLNSTELPAELLGYQKITGAGTNAAAVYYDLLVNRIYGGSISVDKINLSNFVEAAKYFESLQYGLNFVINQKQPIKEIILRIQEWTNSFLTKDQNDKYVIKILKDEDVNTPLATLTDNDMISFSLRRKSWDETFNCFIGTYYPVVDAGHVIVYQNISGGETIFAFENAIRNDYAETLSLKNEANIELTGSQREKTIDLSCYMVKSAANHRLTQVMRQESYPFMNGSCVVNLTYLFLRPGDVIIIRSNEYAMELPFRIMSINYSEIDSNQISLSILQMSTVATRVKTDNSDSRQITTRAALPAGIETLLFDPFDSISQPMSYQFNDDANVVVYWSVGQLMTGKLINGVDYTVVDHNKIQLDPLLFADEIGSNANGLMSVDVFESDRVFPVQS